MWFALFPVCFLLSLAEMGLCQSAPGQPAPKPGTYVADLTLAARFFEIAPRFGYIRTTPATRDDAVNTDLLPDDPQPQPPVVPDSVSGPVANAASGSLIEPALNLNLFAIRPPPFHPANTMWQQPKPDSVAIQTQGTTQPAGAQPIDPAFSVIDQNADFGSLSIFGVNVVDASDALQRMMPRSVDLNAREVPIVDPSSPNYRVDAGPYNWRGLLAQSLFFNVVENTFRAASDDQIRIMLAKKPFWHDYFASTKQFNMRRWNDGDDFLVNYIGHPLQGSVADFIYIQNDPVGRELEIGSDPAYWKSRFHAFLWSVAYSTHSEISFLGEAGIGNEGGWTYPIRCKTPNCPEWHPGWHYTNNTGWVDFTITPTVGFLWMLGEDALDRFVSDHFQGGDRFNLGLAFMRGAINPSRTFANLMRLQLPWYRDFQHDPELENSLLVHPQPSDEQIAEAGRFRRFAIAPFYHTMPMGSPAQPCTMCFSNGGFGVTFDYAITHWLAADFATTSQSGLLQKGTTQAGSTTTFGSGLRFMHDGPVNNISFVVRPTIVTSHVEMPLVLDERHNTYVHPQVDNQRAAVTLIFSNDYKLSKTVAIRTSIADTIVRYKSAIEDPPGIGKPPFLSWLSKDEYTNKSNWSCETGPVIRF
jgi:hypothetical protein